jgi:tetratricopeptide (TPR) repeat protein
MSKNILYCTLGTFLGFLVGFFVANSLTRPGAQVAATSAATAPAPVGEARPLKPEEMAGELPANHPVVGGEAGGVAGSAAATSAEAQAAMDKADRAPKDFASQLEAARVFYGLKDYEKATLYGEQAAALQPKDFDALVTLGNVRFDAGDFAAAETFYGRALEVKPASPDVRNDFGNTFFRRRPPDYRRAISEYRKAIALDPGHETAWKNIAAAALNLGDKATAAEAVERVAALNPQTPELGEMRDKLEALP